MTLKKLSDVNLELCLFPANLVGQFLDRGMSDCDAGCESTVPTFDGIVGAR